MNKRSFLKTLAGAAGAAVAAPLAAKVLPKSSAVADVYPLVILSKDWQKNSLKQSLTEGITPRVKGAFGYYEELPSATGYREWGKFT